MRTSGAASGITELSWRDAGALLRGARCAAHARPAAGIAAAIASVALLDSLTDEAVAAVGEDARATGTVGTVVTRQAIAVIALLRSGMIDDAIAA